MERSFDLVVIGTGSAGGTAAHRCRKAGWEVAIADSRPYGGTCALRGCDPKKVLVGAAEVVDRGRRMEGKGVAGDTRIAWPELMAFKRSFTEPVPESRERSYADAGIETFHGRARFVGPTSVRVGEDTLTAGKVLVAAGAKPAALEIQGEEHLLTSTEFLELETLPERIAFVGGGYISFEFAHVAARAESEVRILHGGDRPLEGFEPELVDRLVEATRVAGIGVELNARVEAVERGERGFRVVTGGGDGAETYEADLVVHGAGRVPEIDDLELEAAGVERDRRGVVVNEHLQSVTNPAVYAAGDAAASDGLPLTPVAAMESACVAHNLLEGNSRKPDHAGVPTVVFTLPPLASVGLGEEAARERGLDFDVETKDTSGWYSSRRVGATHSAHKVLVERDSDRVLGAHLLGPHAEEAINLFALAIREGITAGRLRGMPWAYPTVASDVSHMV